MAHTFSQQLGMSISHMPNKLPPANNFQDIDNGRCSVYPMIIKPGSKAYRYDVEITRLGYKNIIITKGAIDDGIRSLNRKLCNELITSLYARTNGFNTQRRLAYVYDGRKNIFTNMEIQLEHCRPPWIIQHGEMSNFCQRYLANNDAEILLQPSLSFELDLLDFQSSLVHNAYSQANRDLRTFLELLTSQHAINSQDYESVGIGKLFENEPHRFLNYLNGLVIRNGIAKGVRIIDNNGSPCPALVVDAKKCAFFADQPLAQSVLAVFGHNDNPSNIGSNYWRKFLTLYKGVRVYKYYAPDSSFIIESLSYEPVCNLSISIENRNVSFQDYYKYKYKTALANLEWPAVRDQFGKAYPIDQCHVLPNQRVPIEKMDGNLSRELLRLNTVKPDIRYNMINEQLNRIHLSSHQNNILNNFGVSVDSQSNYVKIGRRQNPGIQFREQIFSSIKNGNWTREADKSKFLVSGAKLKWAVMYYSEEREIARNFVNLLLERARVHAIEVEPPSPEQLNDDFMDIYEQKFEELKGKGYEMVVFIDSIRDKTHGLLKLMEVKHKILTQHVTLETARKDGTQTMDNILMKFNTKRNGLCYAPVIEDEAKIFDLIHGNTLVIGYDVSHPSPSTAQERKKILQLKKEGYKFGGTGYISSLEPSVVGICGNVSSISHNFCGDYFYQESRREAVDIEMLEERVISLLKRLADNRPKRDPPEFFFIIRDGVSEGQIPMVTDEEFPAIFRACNKFRSMNQKFTNFQPKFVLVVATKRHFKRFFREFDGGNRIEETVPGSVIDTKVVRADITEFYLQSHKPLHGTAKIPQYVMAINEIGLTMDQIQAFMNMLCNTHQICNSAISIPEPVYQADELAKRGRNNFLEYRILRPIPKVPGSEDVIDFRRLNRILQYEGHPLSSLRYTA